ncbi:hypothetical protein E2C01_021160 [Portunus trituberculatus]|uniref:Uncharacterized protein n=1 Tax=Portunus trituberculatus TaxID=210409 RepID=A0A5B7E2H7_PORTR|nr:hypothetical protein [Portunus trituberculatus]
MVVAVEEHWQETIASIRKTSVAATRPEEDMWFTVWYFLSVNNHQSHSCLIPRFLTSRLSSPVSLPVSFLPLYTAPLLQC